MSNNGPMASPRPGRRPRAHSSAGDTPSRRTHARAEHRAGRSHTQLETAVGEGPNQEDTPLEVSDPVVRSGIRVSRRFIAILVVVAILVISLISSLRVYLNQRAQMSQAHAQIVQSNQQIADLEQEKKDWSDPDYVRAQARTRLGWVMPGESGYRVVGADGQPFGGGASIAHTDEGLTQNQSWWQRLWGSARTADQPAPSATAEAPDKVIAVSPSPTSASSPSPTG